VIRGNLLAAMDWQPKQGEQSGQYTYRQGNKWYIVQRGPGYSNTYEVTDHDEQGLALLLRDEIKEETDAQDRTVQP
jgi:hypothetical protein